MLAADVALDQVTCPACTAPCSDGPDKQFRSKDAAQHFVLSQEYPERHAQLQQHIERLWGADHCDGWTCKACGLGFAQPFRAGDGAFYNLAYPYTHYPPTRWEFGQTLSSLEAMPLIDGPVLEIGPGFGWFLRGLAPRFVALDEIIALEYNEQATPHLNAMGCTVLSCDVRHDDLDKWTGKLSAVFMFQVMEHMDALGDVAARLSALVKPGGDIFVAVPNKRRLDFNAGHQSLLDVPPNHLSQWTESALTAFASRVGWRVHSIQREPLRWRDFMKHDLMQSHVRRAQTSNSLANRVRRRPRSKARSLAEAALALAALPSRLPAWSVAWGHRGELGDSLWARFKR